MGFRNFGKTQLEKYSANLDWEGVIKRPQPFPNPPQPFPNPLPLPHLGFSLEVQYD